MDVRVEARPLTANSCMVESTQSVETIIVFNMSPLVSRFSLSPVLSIGGNSISSINPESFRIGVRAAA
jgi:hypothetical protein